LAFVLCLAATTRALTVFATSLRSPCAGTPFGFSIGRVMSPLALSVTVVFVAEPPWSRTILANVAVAERGAFIVTVHAFAPEQAPLQPAKLEPACGVAVRVTGVPGE
jgi:hypothetical protein